LIKFISTFFKEAVHAIEPLRNNIKKKKKMNVSPTKAESVLAVHEVKIRGK
jgi:hypothetical protein